jgi:hypothetical protein
MITTWFAVESRKSYLPRRVGEICREAKDCRARDADVDEDQVGQYFPRLRTASPGISQHDPIQLLPRIVAGGVDGWVGKVRLSTDLLPAIKTNLKRQPRTHAAIHQ